MFKLEDIERRKGTYKTVYIEEFGFFMVKFEDALFVAYSGEELYSVSLFTKRKNRFLPEYLESVAKCFGCDTFKIADFMNNHAILQYLAMVTQDNSDPGVYDMVKQLGWITQQNSDINQKKNSSAQ